MRDPNKGLIRDSQGRFVPGSGGRPPGARGKTTRAAEALLRGEGEALTRKAIELALQGDTTALRLCLDRLIPPTRERTVEIDLPHVQGAQDVPGAISGLLVAVSEGEITPTEGSKLGQLLGAWIRAEELVALDLRLTALEQGTPLQQRVGAMSDEELLAKAQQIIQRKGDHGGHEE